MELPYIGYISRDIFADIIALALLVATSLYFKLRSRKNSGAVGAKTAQLKSLYKNQRLFLCDSGEDLGKNLIQLYGEPFGSSLRPGMKITGPDGASYTIKEVYADDDTPDKPDAEVPAGTANTPIVIETTSWNWGAFKQALKRDKVIGLKLD